MMHTLALAASCFTSPSQHHLLSQSRLLRRATAPRALVGAAAAAEGAAGAIPMTATMVADEAAAADYSMTDTMLDVGVYGILALVVGLTLYSVVVTLQSSNEQYGGWTRTDEEDEIASMAGESKIRPGAVYDPATDRWTYPKAEKPAAKVGRAPVDAGTQDDSKLKLILHS